MSIPEFNKRGFLDKGIYQCNAEEFILKFCYGEEDSLRKKYKEVLEQLFAFSVKRGVKSVIIGGSFITDKSEPSDLDCIVIFPNEKSIPMQTNEILVVEGCELDVMFVSETNKELIYSLMNLFGLDKYNISVGMIEVVLDEEKDSSTWDDYEEYNSVESLLDARRAYIGRNFIRGASKKKVFVTICNLDEYLLWNYEIAPIISSGGWIFAPYLYVSKNIESHIEKFPLWLYYIYSTYEADISIFADGLGTLLLGKHFNTKSKLPNIYFDRIVLSKSILPANFNWEKVFNSRFANFVINLKDELSTCKLKEEIPRKLKEDDSTDTYKTGFANKSIKLIEHPYKYNEIIESDEFKNNILPLYHISNIVEENNVRELYKNMDLIANREIKTTDIFLKK